EAGPGRHIRIPITAQPDPTMGCRGASPWFVYGSNLGPRVDGWYATGHGLSCPDGRRAGPCGITAPAVRAPGEATAYVALPRLRTASGTPNTWWGSATPTMY